MPTIRYLSQTELAERLSEELGTPIAVSTIQTWRHRYSPNRPKDTLKVAPAFPPPDAWTGDPDGNAFRNRSATPGWRPSSVEKIVAWHATLPGRGQGPRPGRRKTR